MDRLSYDEFMKYNRHKYHKFYRQESDYWIGGEYQYIESEDYFSLYFNINRVEDGSKRRKKLFERICLRRVIEPNVDAETLLFNAYEDRERFFDNSDGVLSIECLVRNVESAMKLTIEEIKETYSENIEYLKSKRPKSGIIFKPCVSIERRSEILKILRWEKLDSIYDPSISLSQNLINLNENGFEIGKDALYSYCKEHGISTCPNKLTDDEIKVLLDINLSVRKNLEILKDSDIKIGIKRVTKLLNELKTNINNNYIYNNIKEDNIQEQLITKSTTYYSESENEQQSNFEEKTDDEVMSLLDINLSVRKNLENLKNNGIKINNNRVSRLLNIIKTNTNDTNIVSGSAIKENCTVQCNLTHRSNIENLINTSNIENLINTSNIEFLPNTSNITEEDETIKCV